MSYYPTIDEDLARAKEILDKGRLREADVPALISDSMRERLLAQGGTIYGGDVYAAYQLLRSFVEAIEAMGPEVVKTALRAQRRAEKGDA